MVGNSLEHMKRIYKKKLSFFLAGLTLLFSVGCEDSRMNNMAKDTIYLAHPGLTQQDIFTWSDFTYDLFVIKSGMGQQSTELEFSVDASTLSAYNSAHGTNYKLLPENYYEVKSKRLALEKNDYRVAYPITFDAAAIATLQATSTDNYVVPFVAKVIGDSVKLGATKNMVSLIQPIAKEPYIKFSQPGMLTTKIVMDRTSADEPWFYSYAETNYPNTWDLTYKLEVDVDLLTAYNTANKTAYKLLPATAYSFDESSLKIRPQSNRQDFRFKIFKEKLKDSNGQNLKGEFAIPIRIKTVSTNKINAAQSTQLIPVVVQL